MVGACLVFLGSCDDGTRIETCSSIVMWSKEIVSGGYFYYNCMGILSIYFDADGQFTYLALIIVLSVGISVGLAASTRGDKSLEDSWEVLKVQLSFVTQK